LHSSGYENPKKKKGQKDRKEGRKEEKTNQQTNEEKETIYVKKEDTRIVINL
jgi:hypothetical protein